MKLTRQKRKNLNIAECGTLSDLAFLLIIFFIVIAVFNINKGILLGLPQKGSTKIINVSDIIKITLTENNELLYENKNINLIEIEEIVKDRLKVRPNMTFLLKISPEAKYQNVVSIVDAVLSLNVDNFSFSMIEDTR
jgi:biopolymer transport protein ExbD